MIICTTYTIRGQYTFSVVVSNDKNNTYDSSIFQGRILIFLCNIKDNGSIQIWNVKYIFFLQQTVFE